jgi:hypothetical protein
MIAITPTPEVVFSGILITIMVILTIAGLMDWFGPKE